MINVFVTGQYCPYTHPWTAPVPAVQAAAPYYEGNITNKWGIV